MVEKCHNFPFDTILNKRVNRRGSFNSDCEQRKAAKKRVACFAKQPSLKELELGEGQAKKSRSSSMKLARAFTDLNNLSQVSNQSTCSPVRSSRSKESDDPFFYEEAQPKNLVNRLSKSTKDSQARKEISEERENTFSSIASSTPKSRHSNTSGKKANPLKKWVPDEFTKRCMNCKRNFDFFVRKHHCRRCGYLLCYSCCGKWARIKDIFKADYGRKVNKTLYKQLQAASNFGKKKTKVRI
jgi:hypothetical protein